MNSDENQAMEEELDVNNATNLSDDVMINTVQNQIMKTYNELKKSVREIVKLESNNQKRNHWALLVVSLDQSIMMYLDSLHYSPPENLLKNVHLFMNYCTPKRQQKKISEKVWKYYRAIDIPKQVDDNCGVYVCAWALTLASSSNTAFGEADMNNIRKAIASFLYKAKTDGKSRKNKVNVSDFDEDNKKENEEHVTYNIEMSTEIPFEFKSTLELCASLPLLDFRPYSHRL
ncbi:hypothetical protein TKK_0007589 [Trichogramma kaykai]